MRAILLKRDLCPLDGPNLGCEAAVINTRLRNGKPHIESVHIKGNKAFTDLIPKKA